MNKVHNITITFESDAKGFDRPMPSPRPRFGRSHSRATTRMPAIYMHHKSYIRKQMPMLLIDGPVKMKVAFGMKIAQSLSKKKQNDLAGEYHQGKPDIDNLLKTVMDAANQYLWKDDGQVVAITTEKRYMKKPKIIIEVEEL